MKTSLFIIGMILTAAVGVIPSYYSVIRSRRGRDNKKITTAGRIVICLLFLTIGIQIWQFFENARSEELQQKAAKADLDRRDSLNGQTNAKNFTDAFGKFSSGYDSGRPNKIVNNYSKTTITGAYQMPKLVVNTIVLDSIKNGQYHFSIIFSGNVTSIHDINLNLLIGEGINGKYYKIEAQDDLLPKSAIVNLNTKASYPILFHTLTEPIELFAFYIYGTYAGSDGLLRSFDQIFTYTLNRTAPFGTLVSEEKINELFHRHQ